MLLWLNLNLGGTRYCVPASAACGLSLGLQLLGFSPFGEWLKSWRMRAVRKCHLAKMIVNWLWGLPQRNVVWSWSSMQNFIVFWYSADCCSSWTFPPFGCLYLFPPKLAIDRSVGKKKCGHCTFSSPPSIPFLSSPTSPLPSIVILPIFSQQDVSNCHRLCNLSVVAWPPTRWPYLSAWYPSCRTF